MIEKEFHVAKTSILSRFFKNYTIILSRDLRRSTIITYIVHTIFLKRSVWNVQVAERGNKSRKVGGTAR